MSATVQMLKDSINNLLNSREQTEFINSVNVYHQQRSVVQFCNCLKALLDTPAKRRIITLLLKIIPKSDLGLFEDIMTSSFETSSLPRELGGGKYHTHRSRKGAASTVSLPASYINTLPMKSAKIIRRPALDRSPNPRPELPNWEAGIFSNVKKIYIQQNSQRQTLGFSIRGGAEHGIGIYVSYVDVESVAERQGLVPGDQILAVNGISLRKVTHNEAAKIIKSHKTLELEVRNVGRVPGSFETHQTYTWVNPQGRTVSPPPEVDRTARYKDAGQRKSGLMLLKSSDERKVNLVMSDTKKLGIKIRGGAEFGLGIYVTGVDPGSIVENGGIKVGDQILDVNGTSFLDISHNDVVKVLRSSRHLILTIKDVGKLPYVKTTYDHTNWLTGSKVPHKAVPSNHIHGTVNGQGFPDKFTSNTESVFSRGAGSQLMHSSMSGQRTHWAVIEEQGKQLLNDNERLTMNYYLNEYEKGNITVRSLVLALLELLNTQAKLSLIEAIRGIITSRDIEQFDLTMTQRDLQEMKSRSMDALMPFNDRLSDHSIETYSSNNSNQSNITPVTVDDGDEMEPLREALSQICEDREIIWQNQIHREEAPMMSPLPPPIPPKSFSHAPPRKNLLVAAEVHIPNQNHRKKLSEENMRSPSEDSGVDIHHMDNNNLGLRVKMSNENPIIINDVLREKAANGLAYYHSESGDSCRSRRERTVQTETITWPDTSVSNGTQTDQEISRLYDTRATVKQSPHLNNGLNVGNNHLTIGNWSVEPQISPEEEALRGLDDVLGVPPPPPPSGPSLISLQYNQAVKPSSHFSHQPQHGVSNGLPPVEETWNQDLLRLPPPPEFAGSNHSHEASPNSHLSLIQVNSATNGNDYSHEKSPYKMSGPQEQLFINCTPIEKLPNEGYGSLRERVKSRRQAREREMAESTDSPVSSPSVSNISLEAAETCAVPSFQEQPLKELLPPGIYPEDGQIKVIMIPKTRRTLGIAIEGGANTKQPLPRIINIQSEGCANAAAGIKIGQIILSVNGKPLRGCPHKECAKTIALAFKDTSTECLQFTVLDLNFQLAV